MYPAFVKPTISPSPACRDHMLGGSRLAKPLVGIVHSPQAGLGDTKRVRPRAPAKGLVAPVSAREAEGEGFEPSTDLTARNGFRDRATTPA